MVKEYIIKKIINYGDEEEASRYQHGDYTKM